MRLFPKVCRLFLTASDGAKTEQANFSGLDFDFSVSAKLPVNEKGKIKTSPVTASVTLHGLNEETRARIKAEKTAIRLEYGYGDDIFEIFEGLNVNAFSTLQSPGWETQIFAKHGWEAYKKSYFSKSYEGETPVKVVVTDVLKSFGLAFTMKYNRVDQIVGGAMYDGESKTVLDQICADWDLNWRIENNSIVLNDSLNPPIVDRSRVAILGPSLIGGPVVNESLEYEATKDEKIVRRVSATSILLPEIWPGSPVRFDVASFGRSFSAVETRALSDFDSQAIYICDTVNHKGSSGAGQGTTEITTREEKV